MQINGAVLVLETALGSKDEEVSLTSTSDLTLKGSPFRVKLPCFAIFGFE